MANLEELVVSLVAETSGLRAELDKATKATKSATEKMDKAIDEFSKNSGKNVSTFQIAMGAMAGFLGSQAVLGAIGLVKDALGFMVDELGEGVQAAIAEEQAMKRLANSLALSGQYSMQAMQGLQAFASEMEATTGVADDLIASNLATLSSLTKLDAEGLKRAQKAALDMSVALGVDLNTATNLVAKGIEGNVGAFKRYGIEVQAGASKAETLSNVLGTLEKRFGGAAAGAAQTFGGAVTNLQNAWGNLTEALATSITQNPVVIAMINKMVEVVVGLTNSAQGASVMFQQVLAKALLVVTEILGTLAGMLDTVLGGVTDKFAKATDALAEINYAGTAAYDQIGKSAAVATPSIQNQTVAVQELSSAYSEMLTSFAQGLADQGAALDNHFQYENELRRINLEEALATESEFSENRRLLMEEDFLARQEMMAAQNEAEWAQLQDAYNNKLITDTEYNNAKTALAQKQYLDQRKFEVDRTKFEMEQQKQREANLSSTLNTIASLSSSSNRQLAAIGKAAAISTATVDGIAAVQKALASAPPPFNFALAAAVGAATAANVAKIAGVGLNKGGTISGGGANRDTVPAMLTTGETVVSRDLTQKLDAFLNGQMAGQQRVNIELTLKEELIEFIEAKIIERRTTNTSLLGTV